MNARPTPGLVAQALRQHHGVLDRHGDAVSGESVSAYSALLDRLVDADRFPALRRAVDAGAYDYPAGTDEEDRQLDYTFGLDRILDGVEALIARRGR